VITPPPPPGNVILNFQQDTGRWSTEYTYSATDGMLGFRGLYNFGLTEASLTTPVDEPPILALQPLIGPGADEADKQTRVDEEEAMEGGLRGRFSAGGEIYFSRKQRSLGGELRI
jgi:distribution and morphology protein 10